MNTSRKQRGFTLVEILVSLAILSIILGALVQSAGVATSNAGRMRDRAIAEWVASNRLAELQLSPSFPETGSKNGEEEMFGKAWYWKTIVQKVEDDDLRRVDVEVRSSEDSQNPLVSIAGFVSHPRFKARSTAARQ